jgi:hypothetical protein
MASIEIMSNPMMIEVAVSFARKIQVNQFEPADFFASRKAEVLYEDAAAVSETLYLECVAEVERRAEQYWKSKHPFKASPANIRAERKEKQDVARHEAELDAGQE